MAIQAKVILQGGVEVPDAYIRTFDVSVKKDRNPDGTDGPDGFYCTCGLSVYKDASTAAVNGPQLNVPELDRMKLVNLETRSVNAGNMVSEVLGQLYGDVKEKIVELGWEASTADIEDV